MSEYRRDLIAGRWIIVAADRNDRLPGDRSVCPFCPGNEEMTAKPEILVYRNADGSWRLRVVPNKFKVLRIEGRIDRKRRGVFESRDGLGAHEVIIISPDHKNIYGLTADDWHNFFWACRERNIDLRGAFDERKRPKIEYSVIFINQGPEAGASQEHAHGQLAGIPFVPPWQRAEFRHCAEYWESENSCLFCEMTGQEISEKERVIVENESFLAVCPYASGFAFEIHVLPKSHWPLFEDCTAEKVRQLAEIILEVVRRLGGVLNNPSFNVDLYNTPIHDRHHDRYYHFSWRITPRLPNVRVAGWELGSGLYINPRSPEEAARLLREVKI